MRGAKRAAVLSALLLPLSYAYAGVTLSDTVSSCPEIIKNVITPEVLLSEEFAPWVGTVYTYNVADTVSAVDVIDVVDTNNVVIGVDIVDVADIKYAVDAGDKETSKKRKIKFGRRAAFNHSQVTDVLIRIYTHDGERFSYAEYRNRAAFGIGFEVAGVIDLVLSEVLALNFSPGVVFRKPINTAVVGTSEVGVSCPLLLEWGPFGALGSRGGISPPDAFARSWGGGFDVRQLRLFGGILAGVPLFAWMKWNGEESASFTDRMAVDFGLIGGVGIYVSDRAFVDVRGILGISKYDNVEGHRLNQLSIGVNYVK